jgi:putative flippase GtrA
VFQDHSESLPRQAMRFAGLYAGIAVLHAGFLLVWTDLSGLDYRLGFLLATGIQTALSYLGNRHLVFAK